MTTTRESVIYLDDPLLGLDRDGNNRLLITVYDQHRGADTPPAIRLRLNPGAALELLRALSNQVTYAARDSALDLYIGDCARCGNIRLIDIPGAGGHMTNTRCPDCGPRYAEAHAGDWPPAPQIGGGLA